MPSLQKKLAGKVLKTGLSRVWLNPLKMTDIEKAITKWDIRKLVKKGDIKKLPAAIRVRGEVKRKKKGHGSTKGKKYAVVTRKSRWIYTIRPQRRMLEELKDTGKLDKVTYRKLYMLAKGGMFRSRAHLKLYMEQNKMLK